MSARDTLLRATAGLGLAGLGALGWATLVEPQLFTLRRYTLPVLPAGSSPLRLLQVSDLHMIPGQERKKAWVRSLADLEPDLVVSTGDNLSHLDAVPHALEAMAPLLELPGGFVLGSNDYYAPTLKNPWLYLTDDYARAPEDRALLPTGELVEGLASRGWAYLDNSRSLVDVDGRTIELVGVDDPHIERDDYAAVAGPAAPDAELTVGVTHAPYQRVLDAMTQDGLPLVVAGHTHGGQLCLPGYGALVTNCDIDRGRAQGVSRWWPGAGAEVGARPPADAAWLHVSAGLGASRFAPVRFACRPEAVLLTLVDGEGGADARP